MKKIGSKRETMKSQKREKGNILKKVNWGAPVFL